MRKRVLAIGIVLVIVLFAVGPSGWAAPPLQGGRAVITYPENGATVSGVVEVRGIATHPDMHFYQVRHASGPEPTGNTQWVDFAIVEGVQVENNVLGSWDTTNLPDGKYTLALAVWGVDDPANPYLFFVTNLRVKNAEAEPTPTPEEDQGTPEPMPTAAAGPTPTPISVEQPPTPTPRPSPVPGGEEGEEVAVPSEGEEDDRPTVALNTDVLRSAFCTGGLIVSMLFVLGGLYILAKASIRWYMRQGAGPPPPRS
jgi:hypothetical protein